ncbi:MAG TPA: SLATT domain-containing protein [Dehalococcoidia bacterium]|nr:SLATT domain-containing protein [Dehalococcoidia bacterium]
MRSAPAAAQPGEQGSAHTLQAQVRELFGRVVHSHQGHQRCAEIYRRIADQVKLIQIGLQAAIVLSSLGALLAGVQALVAVALVCAGVLLALSVYLKNVDPGALAERHAEMAFRLWDIREAYLSLLTDLQSNFLTPDQARARRDSLHHALADVYQQTPMAASQWHWAARKALKEAEAMLFTPEEIDRLLPEQLRIRRTPASASPVSRY